MRYLRLITWYSFILGKSSTDDLQSAKCEQEYEFHLWVTHNMLLSLFYQFPYAEKISFVTDHAAPTHPESAVVEILVVRRQVSPPGTPLMSIKLDLLRESVIYKRDSTDLALSPLPIAQSNQCPTSNWNQEAKSEWCQHKLKMNWILHQPMRPRT